VSVSRRFGDRLGFGAFEATRTLGQGVFFASATAVVSLLSALIKALLARHMSATSFGSYSFALAFLLLTALAFEFGLFLPAARLAAKADPTERREILGASLLTYAGVGAAFCVVVFGSSFVVDSWFHVDAAFALRTTAAVAFVYPFVEVARWLAQGADRLHVYSISIVFAQILFAVSLVALVRVDDHPGIALPLLLQALAMAVGWVVFVLLIRPLFRNTRPYVRLLFQQARAFGFQVYVGRLLSVGTYNMDILMVAIWTNPRQVGLYALAGALAGASGLPVAGVANALFGRMVRTATLRTQWIALAWAIGLVFAAAVWIGARPFFRLVFSSEYVDAARYVLPLALAQAVRGVTGIYNNFLSAQGRGRDLRNAALLLAGSNLALNFALIPPYGAMGAAWASLVALLVNYIAHVYFYRKSVDDRGALPAEPVSALGPDEPR
jgi:O-antigen/teichoic acid export membrane protein